jgi:hypothetical protein
MLPLIGSTVLLIEHIIFWNKIWNYSVKLYASKDKYFFANFLIESNLLLCA